MPMEMTINSSDNGMEMPSSHIYFRKKERKKERTRRRSIIEFVEVASDGKGTGRVDGVDGMDGW